MILISRPWIEVKDGAAFAKVKLNIDKKTCDRWVDYCNLPENYGYTKYIDEKYSDVTSGQTELWFSVDEKFKDSLCVDRADAFVVVLLHYAMATGSDIESEAPVSSMLLYNIRTELIPHLCTGNYREISVHAEAVDSTYSTQACGATGMSCGIDSFFSLWLHQQANVPEDFKLKYLTFFNVGAINAIFSDDVSLPRRNELMLKISREKAAQAQAVANECGLELVFVNSNISDYYRGMLVNSAHYRNCGTAMLLSGLWDKYYYSSGGLKIDEVKFNLTNDPAYYEEQLLSWLSNGTLRLYAAGHGYTRIEKTRVLADYPLAQKYLIVCDRGENCGKCNKCKRTIATLLALNKLNNFHGRFDMKNVEKNMGFFKQYIFLKRKQRFYDDIFTVAEQNCFFTTGDKLLYGIESIPYELIKNTMVFKRMRTKRYRKQIRDIK